MLNLDTIHYNLLNARHKNIFQFYNINEVKIAKITYNILTQTTRKDTD